MIVVFILFVGCKENNIEREPVFFEDHSITACGIKDPLVNMPWLLERCDEIKHNIKDNDVAYIRLLQDSVTKEHAFLIYYSGYIEDMGESIVIDGYDCSGESKYAFWSGGESPDPEITEAFYKNKIFLGTIFWIKK